MAISDSYPTCHEVLVDGQTADTWDDMIRGFEDANIYQTHAYGAVRWGERYLSHLVLSKGGKALAAAQLRIVRAPVLPVGVAYARWGPLCRVRGGEPDPEVLAKMLECMRGEYCGRRGLVLQIIPNAYSASGPGDEFAMALEKTGFREDPSLPRYRTVHVDLTPAVEIMRKRLHQKWRNQLNGAEKNGLEFEVARDTRAYDEFVHLYHGMRDRKGFDSAVDVGEFGRIQETLAECRKMPVFLARKDGHAVGALVCSLMGDTAIYLLGATNDRARELKASYFLHWQAMLWLKSEGARCYDLGGIDPVANPGGHHFKSGFGGNDVTQIAPVSISGGLVGGAVLRGISWLRRKRAGA
ncbi:MAG: peptidoglycan bridge formation glycyltransferase FemA/FemB family protein [Luteolibacter sp.]|nr:peptidoglycan bridge formation glycyltransferase FemA/FemB family protein [Luteolibacter sp.]